MYFIMLRHPKGHPEPMISEKIPNDPFEYVKLFETEKEAEDAGKRNMFGETFGFEVYEW